MFKKVLISALCFCMFFTGATQAFAADTGKQFQSGGKENITPYMDYIADAHGSIYLDSKGMATVSCSVYGYQGTTTKVSISADLQQFKGGKWVTLKTYTASSNSHRTNLSESMTVSKGYAYRVTAEIKAYCGSSVETQTVTSSEANY